MKEYFIMVWDWIVWFFCAFLGLCEPTSDGECRTVPYAGVDHIVCSYKLKDIKVQLFLNDEMGKPFKSLKKLERHLQKKGEPPALLVNGGMYHEDLTAVGLYVEQGKQAQKISTKAGWGNFHLLPNGVFWQKDGVLGISETKQFIARKQKVDFATQSGPMLVIDGKLHPKFFEKSESLKIRNGVGLSKDGKTIHFVLAQKPINFWNFARLFQKELKAHNALFLDGTVSSIRAKNYSRSSWHALGPMVAVFRARREKVGTGFSHKAER